VTKEEIREEILQRQVCLAFVTHLMRATVVLTTYARDYQTTAKEKIAEDLRDKQRHASGVYVSSAADSLATNEIL
jgi:hypothetical protein